MNTTLYQSMACLPESRNKPKSQFASLKNSNLRRCFSVLVIMIPVADGFMFNNPLKQIAVGRAFQSSVLEIITINLFDQSSIMQHVVCDCEDNKFLGLYVLGSLYFGYSFWNNVMIETKLKNVPTYSKSKNFIKQILLLLFLILGKDINSVI